MILRKYNVRTANGSFEVEILLENSKCFSSWRDLSNAALGRSAALPVTAQTPTEELIYAIHSRLQQCLSVLEHAYGPVMEVILTSNIQGSASGTGSLSATVK